MEVKVLPPSRVSSPHHGSPLRCGYSLKRYGPAVNPTEHISNPHIPQFSHKPTIGKIPVSKSDCYFHTALLKSPIFVFTPMCQFLPEMTLIGPTHSKMSLSPLSEFISLVSPHLLRLKLQQYCPTLQQCRL